MKLNDVELNDEAAIGQVLEGEAKEAEQPASEGWSWLKAPTGSGDIKDYLDHPLNFAKSEGLAQIIRGLTGLLGDLRLAVVDIIIGTFRMIWRPSHATVS